jgi:hypothetical protein
MSKHAIPEYFTAQDLGIPGYSCPLCRVQTTSDRVDTGWVYCPLLNNAAICLGCCSDYQKVARSETFDEHPFRDLFDVVRNLTRQSISSLRKTCLTHQEHIVQEGLNQYDTLDDAIHLLQQIQKVKNNL